MTIELELFGRLLAFFELTTAELKRLRADIMDVRDTVDDDEPTDLVRCLRLCLSRVRFIQRQCANVLNNQPAPAPLTAKEGV